MVLSEPTLDEPTWLPGLGSIAGPSEAEQGAQGATQSYKDVPLKIWVQPMFRKCENSKDDFSQLGHS